MNKIKTKTSRQMKNISIADALVEDVADINSWSPAGSFMVRKMTITSVSPSFKG